MRLHHAEAAEGQRGVHVAPRRSAARRVRRATATASSSARTRSRSPCSSSPTCSACPRRITERFRECFGLSGNPGEIGAGEQGDIELNALGWLDDRFAQYIEDRRREPRDDVLTHLALATYPDGTTPDVINVVRTATFLFAAGQETTARLLAAALKHLAEHPELQDELRADRELHPELPRRGAAHREPGEGRLPPRPPGHDGRRRRHRRGHAGDAAERRRQPRPAAVRVPGRVPDRPRRTRSRTSRSAAATTRARARRWRAPRAGSASSASSTACATSASPRSTTARPATAGSATSRRGCCAASPSCTSSSRRSEAEPR